MTPLHDAVYKVWDLPCIGGFYVTSYQANFASHHTRGRHVGFQSPQAGTGKCNKMCQNFESSKHFLLFFSILHCTKGNQALLQNCTCISTCYVVQTLYTCGIRMLCLASHFTAAHCLSFTMLKKFTFDIFEWALFTSLVLCHNLSLPGLPDHALPVLKHNQTAITTQNQRSTGA